MSERKTICAKCEQRTETQKDGLYGKFLHVGCFNVWWRSVYGRVYGPYYSWMRGGMCER